MRTKEERDFDLKLRLVAYPIILGVIIYLLLRGDLGC